MRPTRTALGQLERNVDNVPVGCCLTETHCAAGLLTVENPLRGSCRLAERGLMGYVYELLGTARFASGTKA